MMSWFEIILKWPLYTRETFLENSATCRPKLCCHTSGKNLMMANPSPLFVFEFVTNSTPSWGRDRHFSPTLTEIIQNMFSKKPKDTKEEYFEEFLSVFNKSDCWHVCLSQDSVCCGGQSELYRQLNKCSSSALAGPGSFPQWRDSDPGAY